jgi:hypothetical protein
MSNNFPFNTGVPATDNNPSIDQPDMLENTGSENSIWAVDHISYNSNNGGSHLQTGFPDYRSPVLPSDGGANHPSVAYPAAGVADNTNAQYYFQNALARAFPLSAIRSFGSFVSSSTSGNITPSIQYNVNGSIVQTVGSPNTSFQITLNSNTTTTNNVAVFIFGSFSVQALGYTFVSNILTFTALSSSVISVTPTFNFLVLQI